MLIFSSCDKNSPNIKSRKSSDTTSYSTDALNEVKAKPAESESGANESKIPNNEIGEQLRNEENLMNKEKTFDESDSSTGDNDKNDSEEDNSTDDTVTGKSDNSDTDEKGKSEELQEVKKTPFYLQYIDNSGQYYVSILDNNSIVSTQVPKTIWKFEAIDDKWGGAYLVTESSENCIYVRVGDRGDYGRVIPCEGTDTDSGFILPTRFMENIEEKKFIIVFPNAFGRTEDCLHVSHVDAYEDKPLYMGRIMDCNSNDSDVNITIFSEDILSKEGESDSDGTGTE